MSRAPGDEPVSIEAGLKRAWREVSRDEPPAVLDDAIRAAARKAVHAGPRAAGASPFGGRWRIPLSVAAVLVVSATVTLLVAERDRHGSGFVEDQAAPASVAPAAESSSSAAAPAEPGLPAQSAEQMAPSTRTQPTPQQQQELAGAAQPDLGEHKAIGSPVHTTAPSARTVRPRAQTQRAEESPQPAPSSEAPLAEARHDEAEPAAGAPAPAPSPPRAADTLHDVAPAAADQPAPAATKREARGAVRAKESVAEEARVTQPEAQEPVRKAAPVRAEPGAFPAAPEAALPAGDATADDESLDPKAWLERILDLRRGGKLEEADKSLKAFRERYPDYPLPTELTGLR